MIKLTPQSNALEKSIMSGACLAQKKHKSITGGGWLWRGPESFLQVVVAQQISQETKHAVYIDASMSKMKDEIGKGPGRPAKNGGQRPDISVWTKAKAPSLRTIIEIKRSRSVNPIISDAYKLEKWIKQKQSPDTAYILAYSEAIKDETLDTRFTKWAEKIKWKIVGTIIVDDKSDPRWKWGFVLMRKDKK